MLDVRLYPGEVLRCSHCGHEPPQDEPERVYHRDCRRCEDGVYVPAPLKEGERGDDWPDEDYDGGLGSGAWLKESDA